MTRAEVEGDKKELRARAEKAEAVVAAQGIPEDSAALEKLRRAVDHWLEYPDQQTEDQGDHEAAIKHSAERWRAEAQRARAARVTEAELERALRAQTERIARLAAVVAAADEMRSAVPHEHSFQREAENYDAARAALQELGEEDAKSTEP